MAKIEIEVNPIFIERIIYWIIILVLAGLLIFMYFREPGDTSVNETTTTTTEAEPAPTEPGTTEAGTEPEPAAESCTDDIKNQNEADVDCGGECKACADGKTCIDDADCSSGDCTSRVCTAAPTLSNKIDFGLKDVDYTGGTNTSAKITGVDVLITNGKSTDASLELQIFAKSGNEVYYLNQLQDDIDDETYKPYAVVTLPVLASGKSLTPQHWELDGMYTGAKTLFSIDGRYDPGDDFSIEIQLVDSNTGDVIGTVKKKITV